jgi:hypothetical protein
MNTNTYLGLAMAACLSIMSSSLLAEAALTTDITAPETKINEPLEPSELQRQQEEHKKADIRAPKTSVKRSMEPSEVQREKDEGNDVHINEPLEPSELQRQQMEHNKAIAK